MEAKIQIFNHPAFGEVRTSGTPENPLFCLADVCKVLDLENPREVKSRLQAEDVQLIDLHAVNTNGVMIGNSMANFVNESGLYDVILDSRKPEAKQFRKWITSEVLPSIRKDGGYIVAKPEETPEELMVRALKVAQAALERTKAQLKTAEDTIQLQAPKVLFADAVATSDGSCLIGELAKILNQNGVNIGQNRLFIWLRENGYLGCRGEYWNVPTQRAMDMGLFEIKKTAITKPDGTVLISTTTKVTGKGVIYFTNKFLAKKVA